MAPGALPRPKLFDLEVTVVSAKHLKNVNWKNGDLNPYVILWVDPDRRQATKPDDSGSNRPVWNERFVLPLALAPRHSVLSLEIFHSKPFETPKPLVGTLRLEITDLLIDSEEPDIRNFELHRPSGRPHGKIRLKLDLIERAPEIYQTAPPSGYYYSSAPPPPIPHRGYSASTYSSTLPPPPPPSFSPQPYYSGYYPPYYVPPPPPSHFLERQSSLRGPGPSAPVDYTPYNYHKQNAAKPRIGMGTGLAVGAVAGALGGLALEEGVEYEEEKFGEKVESDLASTAKSSRYGDYRSDY